jgi:erythromycin esterase-like protein
MIAIYSSAMQPTVPANRQWAPAAATIVVWGADRHLARAGILELPECDRNAVRFDVM